MQERGDQQQDQQWAQPGSLQPPPPPYGYQPDAAMAAAKPRSKWRTPVIALVSLGVGIAIGAAAGGSKTSPATTGTASSASSSAAPASSAAAPAAVQTSAAAPAAPAKHVVLTASGNGIKSTKQFTIASGDWSLAYTYNCASFGGQGNMQVSEQGGSNDGLPLVNELGAKGSDVTYQHSDSGVHSLSVNSECAWTLKVTDGDGG